MRPLSRGIKTWRVYFFPLVSLARPWSPTGTSQILRNMHPRLLKGAHGGNVCTSYMQRATVTQTTLHRTTRSFFSAEYKKNVECRRAVCSRDNRKRRTRGADALGRLARSCCSCLSVGDLRGINDERAEKNPTQKRLMFEIVHVYSCRMERGGKFI